MRESAEHLLAVVKLRKEIEAHYAPIKAKLRAAMKEVNNQERVNLAPVKEKEDALREELVLLAESPSAALPALTEGDGKEVAMQGALGGILASYEADLPSGVSYRESWAFEIEDESKISRDYLQPDSKKIRREVSELGEFAEEEVGGIRVWKKRTVVVRSS